MANTYLTRTFGSTPSTTLFTWSAWVKRSKLGTQQAMISGGQSSNTGQLIYFTDDNKFAYYAQSSGSVKCNLKTNAQFRDTNGWYHLMLVVDSTQSNVANRVKFYVNNVEQSYTTTVEHALNWEAYFMMTVPTDIGRNRMEAGSSSSNYFDGVMSHIHMTHGYNYTPSTFGETDSTTGEWKIKTSPTVNYNSNGFFVLKDGNTGTDHSGNSETFSVGGGTLTKTEDCPSNVFCTMNALSKGSDAVLSKGNTIVRNDQNANANILGTIALGNGKYYWENYRHGGGNIGCGITLSSVDGSNHTAIHSSRVHYYDDGHIYIDGFGLSDINTGVTYGHSDIIGVSVDTESGTIKFYKNGTLVNNSTITNSVFTLAQNELIPFWYVINGGEWRTNLGNGYFGTTAVSSAGTNASGNGIFEYDVQPTDATALSTKGLNL